MAVLATCGTYTRTTENFNPKGLTFGLSESEGTFTKAEAWPYWSSAEAVKLEVGTWVDNSQVLLPADRYAYFYEMFQRMRADFDKEWVAVKGYRDSLTRWCKYIKRGMEWDTQFKLLRAEMRAALDAAEAAARASAPAPASKEVVAKAEKAAAEKNKPAKRKERREDTEVALKETGGNTSAAAEKLTQTGGTAGSIAPLDPLTISLWVGGGILALGLLWSFLPESGRGSSGPIAGLGGRRSRRMHRR